MEALYYFWFSLGSLGETQSLENGSFWDISESTKGSQVCRKLLGLHHLASQFIQVQVKNGESKMFWLDYWLPMGRLIDIVGDSGPQRLGVGRQGEGS